MDVIETLRTQYPNMSTTQKRIADFLLNTPEEACFLSMKQLSKRMNTSEVTVINFSRKIGYDSFLQLKKEMQAYVTMRFSPSEKISSVVTGFGKNRQEAIEHVYRRDIDAMQRTYQHLNSTDLDRTFELILNARRIYLVGHNASHNITETMRLRFELLGFDSCDFTIDNRRQMATQLLKVNPSDIFIVISFPYYQKNCLHLCNLLHQQGIPVIAITDRPTAPISEYADTTLACATDTTVFFNSYVAAMMMVNILTAGIAVEMDGRVEHTTQKLRQFESVLNDLEQKEVFQGTTPHWPDTTEVRRSVKNSTANISPTE